ncbi:hypothetical protein [Psychrobacter sp. FDAARGOS_221]|uniref:hypothetical protein n=1 Tax=Psychrobacter sp. FDAARGOS_221 TaxID=1975705 RepID=UPI000BB54BF1|nr:hypothetical protein [Psychrobacter sp. FDAARGOS_221]PNK61451.1 hypothetical protein A6J60_011640 [Psychrobacter sp. FDAARGOS_221]
MPQIIKTLDRHKPSTKWMLVLAVILPLSMSACSSIDLPALAQTGTAATSTNTVINEQTQKTPEMFIGEINRIENLGYSKSQTNALLPTNRYQSDTGDYAVHMPTIKRINGYDLIKTDYAYAKHIGGGVRYALLALVDPKTKEVVRSSIRFVSSTGTGEFDTDTSVSNSVKKLHPTRDFTQVIDGDGRIFKLTPAKEGSADYCNAKGDCRYERAYDMEISMAFLFYYANGGSLNLYSEHRPVEVYLPKNMFINFYNGLKKVS